MALAKNGKNGMMDNVFLSDDDLPCFLAEGLVFFDQRLGTVDV